MFVTIISMIIAAFFLLAEVMILFFGINNLHYAYYYLIAGLISAGLLFIPIKASENKFISGSTFILRIFVMIALGLGLVTTLLCIWLKMS